MIFRRNIKSHIFYRNITSTSLEMLLSTVSTSLCSYFWPWCILGILWTGRSLYARSNFIKSSGRVVSFLLHTIPKLDAVNKYVLLFFTNLIVWLSTGSFASQVCFFTTNFQFWCDPGILIDIHNFQGPHDLIHKSRFITFHYMWYI